MEDSDKDQKQDNIQNAQNISKQDSKKCKICKKTGSGENQSEPLKKCSQCQSVFYCSMKCQKEDWISGHKLVCLKDPIEFIQKQMNDKTLSYDDFEIIRKLGDGNFTEVYQVNHKKFPKSFFALKICSIQKVQNMKREGDIMMEKHALNKIKQKYQSNQLPSVSLIATFKDGINLYFLTEMFKSKNEVWEHCRSFGLLQDNRIRYVFYQICLQVQKLHQIGLIHRDLKPENMFFQDDKLNLIKLIDFGSADDLDDQSIRQTFDNEAENKKRGIHKYFVGTSQYMPPECMHNQPTDRHSDIWSLGCILYQLYTGYPPFRGNSDYLIFQLSGEARFLKLEELQENIIPKQAVDLIKKMVKVNQLERISIEDVLQDQFFENTQQLDQCPELDQEHQSLKDLSQDLIKRVNVHKFDGKQAFLKNLDSQLINLFEKKLQIESKEINLDDLFLCKKNENISDKEQLYWLDKLKHFKQCALLYVFEEDPDQEELDKIKLKIQTESKKSYEENRKKMDDYINSNSEESEEEKKDQENVNQLSKDEDILSDQIGCHFNPNDFK